MLCLVSGGGGSFLKEQGSGAVFFWLGTQVASQSDWFSKGVFKRIGNEILTSFWFDPWVDNVPLRIQYQSFFQASNQCLDRVADMGNWVSGEWVWDFRWRTNLGLKGFCRERTPKILLGNEILGPRPK
ncbi:hypothetical protein A2U01_0000784 [Trifolium medium]|uniref:Uncharacterized protein n=1 Tax=Trifolium medium TaxID=97028 RepID=A0A392LYG6_9FABA|nr:hypothetical protein [Trifolium medium]